MAIDPYFVNEKDKTAFSPYAEFFCIFCGFNFKFKGSAISKSDLWWMGFTDANALVNNKTKVMATARPQEQRASNHYL